MSKSKIFFIAVFLVLALFFGFFDLDSFQKTKASADWLTGWEARRIINITNSASQDLTNYEVDVSITYDERMNNDFSDVRFTDGDGITLLNFGWDIKNDGIEAKEGGNWARAVVQIPVMLVNSEKVIYMYYDNPSASSTANLENTLTWFDHFDIDRSLDYHNNGDNIVWDTENSLINLDLARQLVPKPAGQYVVTKDLILKTRTRFNGDGYYYQDCWRWAWGNGRNYGLLGNIQTDEVEFRRGKGDGIATTIWKESTDFRSGIWYSTEIKMYENDYLFKIKGGNIDFTREGIDNTNPDPGVILLRGRGSDYDYLYVRQYSEPEPTVELGAVEIQEIVPNLEIPEPVGWFNSDWEKRQQIIIDNTENRNDLVDYEFNVEIPYNSAMNTDFSDIRFTDEDGQTLLDFGWDINDDGIENKIDGLSAIAVVKVPHIPDLSLKAIYLYYDNPSASSTTNLENALTWFDHFDIDRSSDYHNNGDNIVWDTENSLVNLDLARQLVPKPDGQYVVTKDLILKTRIRLDGDGYYHQDCWRWAWGNGRNYGLLGNLQTDEVEFRRGKGDGIATTIWKESADFESGIWYSTEIKMYENDYLFKIKGGNIDFTREGIDNTNPDPGVILLRGRGSDYDYLYVRQKTKPEPTIFEFGEVQTYTSVTTINVAVILAEPSDVPYSTDQTCLNLLDENGQFYEKCYENGHTKEYYYDLANNLVNNYYNENSYGSVQFNFEIFDNEGSWYKITDTEKDEEYYGKNFEDMPLPLPEDIEFKDGKYDLNVGSDAYGWPIIHKGARDRTVTFIWNVINLVDQDIDYNEYNVIVVVHSGKSEQTDLLADPKSLLSLAFPVSYFPINAPEETAQNWISVSETELTGVLVHELGHNLGTLLSDEKEMLPDLYSDSRNGNIEYWGTMGSGYELPIKLNIFPQYTRPSHLSSYSKIRLKWLTEEEVVEKKTYTIESLETMKYKDAVKKYDLPDNSYYLLEARTRDETYSTWDTELPGIPSDWLVIYKVKEELINNEQHDIVNIVKTIDTLGIDPRPLKDAFDNLIGLVNWSKEENSFKMSAEITDWSPSNYIGLYLKTKIEVLEHVWDSFPVSLASIHNEQIIKLEVKDFTIPSNDQDILAANSNLEEGKDTSIMGSKAAINPPAIYFICLRIKPWLWSILIVIVLAIILLLYSLIKRLYPRIRLQKKVYIFILLLILCIIGTFFIVKLLLYCQAEIIEERQYRQGVENDTYTNPLHQFSSSIGLASASGISSILSTVPDLDLHAYDDQGRHVGVNYETGEYENQIPGAEASGDLVYDDEWIFVPEDTEVHFVVSSQDIQEMLEEYPELQEITDGIETYEVQAIYYDTESQRYESNILIEQIEPGVLLEQPVTGTVDITVLPAQPFDITPPTTSVSFSDTIGQNDWYLSDVLVTLTAFDNENGTGVDRTEYSFDQQTWQTYTELFTISEEGTHTVYYRSIDKAENIEEAKSIEIKIDKTLPEIIVPVFVESYIYKQSLIIEFSALDVVSGIASISATLNNQSILSGQEVILDQSGTNVFTITATDYAGHSQTKIIEFKVFYDFSGFLPLLSKKTKYNLGQTIPVKFQLKDYQGAYISDIQPRIYIAEIINGEVQPEQPAVASGNSNLDNITRYDLDKNQYIFNFSTKDLFSEQYKIRADLDDESTRTIDVNLKKGKKLNIKQNLFKNQ